MNYLGLTVTGKNFNDIKVEVPLNFAAKLKSLREFCNDSVSTPAKTSKYDGRGPYGESDTFSNTTADTRYKSSGLLQTEYDIKSVWNSSEIWGDVDNFQPAEDLRKRCFERFSYATSQIISLPKFKESKTDSLIVDNFRAFIKDLHSNGTRSLTEESAVKMIVRAASYTDTVSHRTIADRLDFNRNQFSAVRKVYAENSLEVELSNDDMYEDETKLEYDDDDIDTYSYSMSEEIISDPYDVFVHELPLDYVDDPSRFDIYDAETEVAATIEKKSRFSSDAGDFVAALSNSTRIDRKDAVDLGVATAFWHNNTQYNTNTNRQHLVFDLQEKKWMYHREQLQTATAKEMY